MVLFDLGEFHASRERMMAFRDESRTRSLSGGRMSKVRMLRRIVGEDDSPLESPTQARRMSDDL